MSECRMLGIVLLGTVLGGGAIGFALYLIRPPGEVSQLSTGSGWTPTLWLGVAIIIATIAVVLAIVAIVSKRLEEGWAAERPASRIAPEQEAMVNSRLVATTPELLAALDAVSAAIAKVRIGP
mgnify:CR=1 FL=1